MKKSILFLALGLMMSLGAQTAQADELSDAKEKLKTYASFAQMAMTLKPETAAVLEPLMDDAQNVFENENATLNEINEVLADFETTLTPYGPDVMSFLIYSATTQITGLAQEDDNKECKQIIADAVAQLNTLKWDNEKSFEENLQNLLTAFNLIDETKEVLKAVRSGENLEEITAAKKEMELWAFAINMVYQVYDLTGNAEGLAEMEALLDAASAISDKLYAPLDKINGMIATLTEAANAHTAEIVLYYQLFGEEELNTLLEEGDSQACKNIVAEAKKALSAMLVWDDEKSMEGNIDALAEIFVAIYDQAQADLATQRAKDTATGIEEAEGQSAESQKPEVESGKVIRNGQLLIIRNGVLYNAQGAVVKN